MQQLLERSEQLVDKGEGIIKKVGNYMVDGFKYLALFVIGATIVWSAVATYMEMIGKGAASVDDILLLFIFLELGAMVGIYFKTNRLPVQFLLFQTQDLSNQSSENSDICDWCSKSYGYGHMHGIECF